MYLNCVRSSSQTYCIYALVSSGKKLKIQKDFCTLSAKRFYFGIRNLRLNGGLIPLQPATRTS